MWLWVCILGPNVNLIPTVDCGQKKFVIECSIAQASLLLLKSIWVISLRQKEDGQKQKKNWEKEKRDVVFGVGDGAFLGRGVERSTISTIKWSNW